MASEQPMLMPGKLCQHAIGNPLQVTRLAKIKTGKQYILLTFGPGMILALMS